MASIKALRQLGIDEIRAILGDEGAVTDPRDIARLRLLSALTTLGIRPLDGDDVAAYKRTMLGRFDALENFGDDMAHLWFPESKRNYPDQERVLIRRSAVGAVFGMCLALAANAAAPAMQLLLLTPFAMLIGGAVPILIMLAGMIIAGRYTGSRWERKSYTVFTTVVGGTVPKRVESLVMRIMQELPDYIVSVDYLRRDPFIVVHDSYENEFYVAVWDEKGFRTTDC